MPRYWILCMSEDNYEIARQHGLIGMSERAGRAMQQHRLGDMITFYINRKNGRCAPERPCGESPAIPWDGQGER